MSKFFDELMASVQQMNEILRGEREPPRELHVDALQVKKICRLRTRERSKVLTLHESENHRSSWYIPHFFMRYKIKKQVVRAVEFAPCEHLQTAYLLVRLDIYLA